MLIGYLAGIIDGEGYIGISRDNRRYTHRRRYVTRLTISNTNLALLEAIRAFVGGGHIYPMKQQQSHHTPAWQYVIQDRATLKRVLLAVHPHLIIKKAQAAALIQFLQHDDAASRESLVDYVASLNRRPRKPLAFNKTYPQPRSIAA